MVVLRTNDEGYQGIVWNTTRKRTGKEIEAAIDFPADGEREYLLITKTVDEDTCNPLRFWHDMGEPSSLSERQRELLREAARPLLREKKLKAADGSVKAVLTVKEHGVVYFELYPITMSGDRGYDYERVMQKDLPEADK